MRLEVFFVIVFLIMISWGGGCASRNNAASHDGPCSSLYRIFVFEMQEQHSVQEQEKVLIFLLIILLPGAMNFILGAAPRLDRGQG